MKYLKEYKDYAELEEDIEAFKNLEEVKKKELSIDKEDEENKVTESNSEFDIEFTMSKIKEHFPVDEVIDMFDQEVMEWVDSDWEDDYESEYDWYIDHNNGEAQDVIIETLINWYKSEYELSSEDELELFDRIKQEYDCLNYL